MYKSTIILLILAATALSFNLKGGDQNLINDIKEETKALSYSLPEESCWPFIASLCPANAPHVCAYACVADKADCTEDFKNKIQEDNRGGLQ